MKLNIERDNMKLIITILTLVLISSCTNPFNKKSTQPVDTDVTDTTNNWEWEDGTQFSYTKDTIRQLPEDSLWKLKEIYRGLAWSYGWLLHNKHGVYPAYWYNRNISYYNNDKEALEWAKKHNYYDHIDDSIGSVINKLYPSIPPPDPTNKELNKRIDSLLKLIPSNKLYDKSKTKVFKDNIYSY